MFCSRVESKTWKILFKLGRSSKSVLYASTNSLIFPQCFCLVHKGFKASVFRTYVKQITVSLTLEKSEYTLFIEDIKINFHFQIHSW